MSEGLIGASIPRLEDKALLRGAGRFADDIHLPGMLHIAFVRSAFAHALIKGVDADAARTMAGVHAVLTIDDLRPHLTDVLLRTALPSPSHRLDLHRPVLADGEAVYVGEPIVAVVADNRYLAEDAAALVIVDYEELPAVVDCRTGLEPNAPHAHSREPHNLAAEFSMGYGDAAAAFAAAPVIVKESLSLHRGGAHSIEGRGVVATLDPGSDVLTVWTSTQTPHQAKRLLCGLLSRDDDRVRVIAPDVGGGFGPKLIFYPEEAVVAVAAQMLKRPIKWIEDRREHFVATTQERDQIWDMELAADREGRLLGLRGRLLHEHGAYTARGVNVPYGSASALTLPYVIPTYSLDVQLVVTNKTPVTPIRGAGQPQAVFVMERLLDRLALELGLDRAEIRRRNLVSSQTMPYKTPMRTRGGMQIALDSGDYVACMEAALEHAGWRTFQERRRLALKQGRHIGLGVANYVEGTGRGPFEPVRVRVSENGRILVASGAASMGQGTRTMLAQIVAEQLGGDVNNVSVTLGDTAAIELGIGAFNSRQTVMAGSSAHAAAVKVREKIIRVASHMLDVGGQALEIVGSSVRLIGDERRAIPLGEIARAIAGLPGYYIPGGVEPGLDATERVVMNDMAYSNGTCAAEVEVDIETGDVRVQRMVFAHDSGRIVNPLLVDGQIAGGIAHGLGNALFERMIYDESGQPLSMTLAEYLLITAPEMPHDIDIVHQQTLSPLNELGMKGVGESGVLPVAAAVASAVDDALSPHGAFVRRVPIHPQDVIEALKLKRPE